MDLFPLFRGTVTWKWNMRLFLVEMPAVVCGPA
jgi:hypothetical protein